MASTSDVQTRPATIRFRPRFTLAALLALVTLSALAAWYWFRLPFEVETPTPQGGRQVETVRRVWGGKTLRHGPLCEFDKDGHKIAEIRYREGMLHGPSQWFDSQERPVLTLNFERGKLVEPLPADVESGIAKRLVDGEITDDRLIQTLLQTAPVEFVETPFVDCMHFLEAQQVFPIEIDARSMEENGVSIDMPVSMEETRLPLIATLGRILKPLKLTCDYRYGVLFVTTPKRYAQSDQSGVDQIVPPKDSRLAAVWNKPIKIEFLETPLDDAFSFLTKQTDGRLRFDLSHLPANYHDYPITRTMHQPPPHFLGAILDEYELCCELEGETLVLKLREP